MCAMPALKINIQQPEQMCRVKPMALIQIFLHAHRFWHKDDPKSEYAYGILVGSAAGKTRTIEKAIPILHSQTPDVVFDESFYKHWDDLNKLEEELESGLYCIGWYKCTDKKPIKFMARDIRNQVRIQSETPEAVAMILDPTTMLEGEGYGFSFYHLLRGDSDHLHEMCEDERIPWEIMELGNDVDKVVMFIAELIDKFDTDKPYIEEIDESGVPGEGGFDWKDDDGYVTPDFDPNMPTFF